MSRCTKSCLTLLLASALLVSGCAMVMTPATGFLYSDVKGPYITGPAEGQSKTGTSECVSILGLIADGDASIDNGPTGGLTWDGRVDRGREQARLPLLSPLEMANDSPATVVAAVARSAHAGLLRQALGKAIFADAGKAFDGIVQALEAYQQRYTEFYPYSSKYDAYLAGKARLTDS